jgi:hypothetical protein
MDKPTPTKTASERPFKVNVRTLEDGTQIAEVVFEDEKTEKKPAKKTAKK